MGGKMKRVTTLPPRNPRGSVLVLSLVFIAMFSALAAALATLSGANTQVAENFRKADATRGCAESGLEVMRYWISKVDMSGQITPSSRFSHLFTTLQTELSDAGTNIVPVLDSSGPTITIASVPLLATNQSFSATLTALDVDTVRLEVTGVYGPLTRTLRTTWHFQETHNTVFDYGLVTKGPLSMQGSVEVGGVVNVMCNAYIESPNNLHALDMQGKSSIAGNVKIANPLAYVSVGSSASVGEEKGDAAIKNIKIGVPPASFAELKPGDFTSYATNPYNPSSQILKNVKIPPNTNPKFTSQTTIEGVLYVESPNVVEFAGGAHVIGVIVTTGSLDDSSGTTALKFTGNVTSLSVDKLGEEYGTLRDKTGTFIIAPGCTVSFGGDSSTVNGAIAASGISFSGNGGGEFNGSVINYADKPMTLGGNANLFFNRTPTDMVPAGFVPRIVLSCDRSSYSEV